MKNNPNPGEKVALSISQRHLTRREWVQRMLAGAGAGIAAPTLATTHPPLANGSAPVAATKSKADAWKPAFFDDYQNQTLIALAEKIVPGSTGVQVNRFLDSALSVETLDSQQKFVASMNALEGESMRRFTRPFMDLSDDQQDQVLTTASTAPPSNPSFADETAEEIGRSEQAPAPVLRDYFDYLKGWISMAYYSSETGMKELGWTGENFFSSFPGCEQPGSHS